MHIHTFTAAEANSLILYYGRGFRNYDDHSLCRYPLLFDEAPGRDRLSVPRVFAGCVDHGRVVARKGCDAIKG